MRGTDHDPDRSIAQEASGACGDLGTFIPDVIGAMTVAGLAQGVERAAEVVEELGKPQLFAVSIIIYRFY